MALLPFCFGNSQEITFNESSPWGTVPNKRGGGKPVLIRADGAGFLKWHNFD